MTQHMQDNVSTADSAEQRHELSHSHREGREEGVPQATQRHRPHTTQMMDSDGLDGLMDSGDLMSACLGSPETEEERAEGGEVITDAAAADTVMGLCLCEALRPERPEG